MYIIIVRYTFSVSKPHLQPVNRTYYRGLDLPLLNYKVASFSPNKEEEKGVEIITYYRQLLAVTFI